MVTGGGPGGSTWLRSLSPAPVMKASGALTRAGAAEWPGLAVTACVRLLGERMCGLGSQTWCVLISEMVSQVGGRHWDCDESLHVSPRS